MLFMGAASSDLDRAGQAQVLWTLPHHSGNNVWTNYVMSRYGMGYSVTGVSASLALPRLLRRRMQDWIVDNLAFYFVSNGLSFGRSLQSVSRAGSSMFYGVDIRFGSHEPSWFYCKPTEWLLQLHKAILEPFNDGQLENGADRRFPGRAYYIGDEAPPAAVAANTRTVREVQKRSESAEGQREVERADAADEAKDASSHQDRSGSDQTSDTFTHQLCIFMGNADGHVGLLTLPIPANKVEEVESVVESWEELEAPCFRAGRQWTTAEEFLLLREEHVNLPDLLLLALEPDIAMSLTPDWTWEKYPRGYGEVAQTPTGFREGDGPLLVSSTSNSSIASGSPDSGGTAGSSE